MADQVDIRSIEALSALKVAIGKYSYTTSQAIQRAEAEIQQVQQHIYECEQRCRRAIQTAEQELEYAQSVLYQCENSGYYDEDGYYHQPDCSHYEYKVSEVHYRLQRVEESLAGVQHWKRQIEYAEQKYRTQINIMSKLLDNDIDKASLFLDQKVRQLREYVSVRVPSLGSSSIGTPASTAKSTQSLPPIAVTVNQQHILHGDNSGGGHLWPGQPGKTSFPQSWDGNKILDEVANIAGDPKTKWYVQTGNGGLYTKKGTPARWRAWETQDGVQIRVVYEPATGKVVAAFPDSSVPKGKLVL